MPIVTFKRQLKQKISFKKKGFFFRIVIKNCVYGFVKYENTNYQKLKSEFLNVKQSECLTEANQI